MSLRSAGALALVSIALFTGALRANEPPMPEDLALVPSDPVGVIVLRPASLLARIGPKKASSLPLLEELEKGLGLPLTDVERMTFVIVQHDRSQQDVVIVRTNKRIDIDALAGKQVEDAVAKKRVAGHEVYFTQKGNKAVVLVGEKIALIVDGGPAEVKDLLGKQGERCKGLAKALALADRHEIVGWSKAVPGDRQAPCPPVARCCCAATTSYKPRESPQTEFALFPVPLTLEGVEEAVATIDFGDTLQMTLEVTFRDAKKATAGAKMIRSIGHAARAQVLMGRAFLGGALDQGSRWCSGSICQRPPDARLLGGTDKLLGRLEFAMRKVSIKAEGKCVPLTLSVPVSADELKPVLYGWGKLLSEEKAAPTPVYRGDRLPNVVPAPCFPADPLVARLPPPPPAKAPPAVAPEELVPPADHRCREPLVYPSDRGKLVSTPRAPSPTPSAVKLTVANVSGGTALIYSLDGEGGLTLHRELPGGEAVDVETTPGQRWVAIFSQRPGSPEKFQASEKSETWLLRRPEAPVPTAAR